MRCVHIPPLRRPCPLVYRRNERREPQLSPRLAGDEIAICNRAQLRNLHDQMALLYVEVGKQVKDRTRFRQEQRLFISKRRACGRDSIRLKAVYNQRLAELNSMKHR